MHFGVAVPSYGKAIAGSAVQDMVMAVDELGFDSIWWPDHIVVPDYATEANLSPPFLEPLAACAWGLGATSRVRFGVDVLVASYRHPLTVAAMTATMATLAGDRFILGVGIGYLRGEFEALGVDYEARGTTTDAWLATLRQPPVGHTLISPPMPVPVWVGGNGAAARRRAAEHGDGWHPLWMPPDDYRAGREEILRRRRDGGLADVPFTFSFSAGVTRFADRPAGGWPAPSAAPEPGSEFAYAPPPWLAPDGRPRLVGTPDDLIADLESLRDAGVDHVTLRFGTTKTAPLERFAREVLPAFGDC